MDFFFVLVFLNEAAGCGGRREHVLWAYRGVSLPVNGEGAHCPAKLALKFFCW